METLSSACSLCLRGDIDVINSKFINKEIGITQISDICKVDKNECIVHIYSHVKGEFQSALAPKANELVANFNNKVQVLEDQLTRVVGNIEKVNKIFDEKDIPDAKLIQAYSSLEKTLTSITKEAAVLNGEVKEVNQVNIQNNTVNVNDYSQKLLQLCCDNCIKKLSDAKVKIPLSC